MNNFSKIAVLIGFLLNFINESVLINIECKFDSNSYYGSSQSYRCVVQNDLNFTSSDAATITSVTGIHKIGRKNFDVQRFDCRVHKVQYFPKGLENFFSNLKLLNLMNNKIKEIHQAHLKPFPKLEYLSMFGNLIEILEQDLFKFNRGLQFISFSQNKITYIHPNVFDNLAKLSYLYLWSLPCMDMSAENSSIAVKEVIKVAKLKCIDPQYSALDEKIKNLEVQHNSLSFVDYRRQLAHLEDDFKDSKYSKIFQRRFNNLQETKVIKESEANMPKNIEAFKSALKEYQAQVIDIKNILNENQVQIADIKNSLIDSQVQMESIMKTLNENQAKIGDVKKALDESHAKIADIKNENQVQMGEVMQVLNNIAMQVEGKKKRPRGG